MERAPVREALSRDQKIALGIEEPMVVDLDSRIAELRAQFEFL